jgi:delta 1-pyrroline-5-carboxylate dehydrogenase
MRMRFFGAIALAASMQTTVIAQEAPMTPLLRTTCVATLLEGGHASNALPQLVKLYADSD